MLSALASQHVASPRNRGEFEGWTHRGVSGSPGDGPYVQLWLVVEDGKVQRAGYETHGCPSSVAASSVLCTLLTGMAVETAMTITQQDLLTVLGGLPEGKERFAGMAVEALHHGLERAN